MDFVDIGKDYFFPQDEFDRRIAAVRGIMQQRNIDVLLCTERENIYYLCGHQTFSYATFQLLALPIAGEPILVVRYFESMQAHHHTYLNDIVTWDDIDDPVAITIGSLKRRGLLDKTIAVEERSNYMDVATWKKFGRGISNLVDGSLIVESVRARKSPLEVAHMRQAGVYTDRGMEAAVKEIAVGVSENDVTAAAFDAMTRAGSEWLAKDPIVTSGVRAGIPHTTYRRRRMEPKDTVLLEFSGVHHRYFCPMMRTVVVGTADPEIDRFVKICLEGLDVAIEAAKPGATAGEVDAACQKVIHREGVWENYRKRAGYAVGIGFGSWIEASIGSLKADDTTILAPGMCYHIPVALRLYGKAAVGFSETIHITERGAEVLGKFPRKLNCK